MGTDTHHEKRFRINQLGLKEIEMRMKSFLAFTVSGLLLVAVTSVRADQGVGSAHAHAIDGSGIQGRIAFLDSGDAASGLVVSGRATGLDPAQGYVSLVYDRGAVPGGPNACLPTGGLTGAQMFVGFWKVDEDGIGSLFVTKNGDAYVPIDDVGAVSIRLATMALQACGRVQGRP